MNCKHLSQVFLLITISIIISVATEQPTIFNIEILQDPVELKSWINQQTKEIKNQSRQNALTTLLSYWKLLQGEIGTNFKSLIPKLQENIKNEQNVGEDCRAAFAYLSQAVLEQKMDALQILDAMGKVESGVLQGNVRWLGSLNQCHQIKINESLSGRTNRQYGARHCTGKIVGNQNNKDEPFLGILTAIIPHIELGLCLPDVCKTNETRPMVKAVWLMLASQADNVNIPGVGNLGQLLRAITPTVRDCKEKLEEQKLTIGAIIAIAVLVGMATVILFSTIGHYVMIKLNKSTQSVAHRIILSFSLKNNLEKLFSPPGKGSITCLNGIRTLSIYWVLLGHTFLFAFILVSNISEWIEDFPKRWSAAMILNATVSVDTFFVMSGLLVTYLFFKEIERQPNLIKKPLFWLQYYVHRYWRLTPPLLAFILIYTALVRYIGDGLFYPSDRDNVMDTENCRKYWWTNILYINNFYPADSSKQCIGHSWYLANDFQFYLVSPIFLVAFYFGGLPLGSLTVLTGVLLSAATTGILNSSYGFKNGNFDQTHGYHPGNSHFSLIYIKPYCRIGPYAIGMLLGYVLHRYKKIKMNIVLVLILWAVAAALALGLLFAVHNELAGKSEMGLIGSSTYWALMRNGWALSISWLIFACAYGYGGPINEILSWPGFAPLARLSYGVFLVHALVNNMFNYTFNNKIVYSDTIIIYLFFGNIFSATIFGGILSMTFEAPLIGLEKIIFKKSDAKHTTSKEKQEDTELPNGNVEKTKPSYENGGYKVDETNTNDTKEQSTVL